MWDRTPSRDRELFAARRVKGVSTCTRSERGNRHTIPRKDRIPFGCGSAEPMRAAEFADWRRRANCISLSEDDRIAPIRDVAGFGMGKRVWLSVDPFVGPPMI